MHHILQKRDLWCLWSFHTISFVCCQLYYYYFLANGLKIDSPVNSGYQTLLDSGFHINVDSGLQSTGFRIPRAKISWIPDSVTWGEAFPTPYSKYH